MTGNKKGRVKFEKQCIAFLLRAAHGSSTDRVHYVACEHGLIISASTRACLQPKKIKVWSLKLRELVRDLAQIFSARPAASLSSIRLKSSIFPRTEKHARPAVLIYNDGLLASYMQLFVHDRRFADLPYIFCMISPPRAKRRYDNKTVSPKRVEIDSCWKELIFKIISPII